MDQSEDDSKARPKADPEVEPEKVSVDDAGEEEEERLTRANWVKKAFKLILANCSSSLPTFKSTVHILLTNSSW